jgi:hypothetical protein
MDNDIEGICIAEDWVIDKILKQGDMIMRNLGRISSSVIILLLSCASFVSAYSGGTGEPNNPYLISTPSDLDSLGATSADWSKNFKMTADINMSGYTGTQYRIIGNQTTQFTGSFDGDGHVIRNLTYTTITAGNYVGLFGYTNGAAIKNLGLEDVDIYTGGGSMGGLVGYQISGTITSCYTTGSVTSDAPSSYAYAGGLVGYQNSGAITSSYSTSSIITTANSSAINGGIVGWQNSGSITSSYSTGNITATSNSATAYAGGLVGSQNYGAGPITSCYSTGNVVSICNGPSIYGSGVDVFAGGLMAACWGSVVNCYSTGQVSATGNHFVYKGGLLGYEFGTPTASFWDINTSGLNTSAGGTGKTTAEMKTLSTFTSAGWDFTNETVNGTADIWRMCTDGVDYPRLTWEFTEHGDLVCPDGVNFVDFAYFADRWHTTGCNSSNNFCGGADMDSSGTVDMTDLEIFAANWLVGYWVCPDNVNFVDFAYFAERWQITGCDSSNNFCGGTDMYFSGTVDIQDLAIFASHWLKGI